MLEKYWPDLSFCIFLRKKSQNSLAKVRIHSQKSEFTGEMESDFREVILSHCEYKLRIGHEDVAAFAVESHELVFALLECFEG